MKPPRWRATGPVPGGYGVMGNRLIDRKTTGLLDTISVPPRDNNFSASDFGPHSAVLFRGPDFNRQRTGSAGFEPAFDWVGLIAPPLDPYANIFWVWTGRIGC